MIEKIIRCDHCNKGNAKSYLVVIDKEPDPSGNGYITVDKFYDFCFSCLINYVRKNKDYKILEH